MSKRPRPPFVPFGRFFGPRACLAFLDRHIRWERTLLGEDIAMIKDDTAVFHAFAFNPVTLQYDDWRGMGTRAAIAERSFEAQGPIHYCPKEWLKEGWLDKPKGR